MKVQTFNLLFAMLTVIADLAVIGLTFLALGARVSDGLADARDAVWDRLSEVALPLAAVVGLTATLGSLYYSEVADFIPCQLCWYQRIAMYPMPVILLIAAWKRDRSIRSYVIPLALIGAAISIYHYQLERFPDQSSGFCTAEAPCTVVWVWMFHFISIPFMALSGFALIAWLVWIAGQRDDDPRSTQAA
jgi:disulfide bond formation protein DsbB